MGTLNWGILGLGRIAGIFAKGVLTSKTGKLVAVASRGQEKADAFGKDFLGSVNPRRYASYEALLADPEVQAIYIATPHPLHAYWAIRCLEAGKHVLVEKPIGINHAQAMTVINAARENKRFLMEAFMYRCHPMVAKVIELVKSGAIGEVRAIQANFAFNCGNNPESRLLANNLGGGGILDVGCYCTSMARLVAGAAIGIDGPAEPLEFKATGFVGPTGADEFTFATLKFKGVGGKDLIAALGTGVQVGMDNVVRIYGSSGSILMNRWVPADTGNVVILNQNGKPTQEIACDTDVNVYGLEADRAAYHIGRGELEAATPAMSWNDTLGNMKVLDRWRAEIGQIYDSEKPENQLTPIDGRPLTVRQDACMLFGTLPGVDKPISRLIMGVDNQYIRAMPHASAMFDDYFQRGGNTFDSAYIYGGGNCERAIGQWVKNRNLREKVVILAKGAHAPQCTPAFLSSQLAESLERYQTNYVDIYLMHRDNPDVPVGEFVDVLNEHKKKGQIRCFGGSNWSKERLDAANEYARKKGLTGFSAVSNNFSLARMVNPVWGGCIASSEPSYKAWHQRTQMPVLAWSSQARGFFTVGDPSYTADESLVTSWYSPDNFQRQARAKELAAKKGCAPLQIALAYVLYQPFPTFALIGPRQIEETRTSFMALSVKLTPDEVKWLNLES